jgi:hypothetical protein
MKIMTTQIVIPNIIRVQVDKFLPSKDDDVPYGILYIILLMAGGKVYGPQGKPVPFVLTITDEPGRGLAKNATPTGAYDLIIEQPNPRTGVFSALLAAWEAATPQNKNQRNLAVEALLVTQGVLSADLGWT